MEEDLASIKRVPFLDLSREIKPIRTRIDSALNKIMYNTTDFILGESVGEFEKNFSNYISTQFCVGVANGTDALEMAVASLGLSETDEIITQANTYVATCFGVTNTCPTPILKIVDIDPSTFQMDLDDLERNITPQTKAVIIVHITGSCCNMSRLMDIVKLNNLVLIEDCAQSHGAQFGVWPLGSFGDISTFSFYPGKNLGAFGDGGAICTSSKDRYTLFQKMRNNGSIEKYKHETAGRNSRLDTIHAAVLNIKLSGLTGNNQKRRNIAEEYRSALTALPEITLPRIEFECEPVYHLYVIQAERRDELKAYLESKQIGVGIHYPTPIRLLECYRDIDPPLNICENAEMVSRTMLSLPMFPNLTSDEIQYVANTIWDFYNHT